MRGEQGATKYRPVVLGGPTDFTREQQDVAVFVLASALAEIGIATTPTWSEKDHCHHNIPPVVDLDALYRAKRLGLDAAGMPYEMQPYEEWEWADPEDD